MKDVGRWGAVLGLLVLGVGCGAPAPIEATPRPVATIESGADGVSTSSAQTMASGAVTEPMPRPPLPGGSHAPIQALALSAVACKQPIEGISLVEEKAKVKLCDATGKVCFLQSVGVELRGADLTASIAQGENPSVLVEFGYEGFSLRGFLADPPQWFAAHPVAFGGFYVADRIEVKAGHEKELVVAAPLVEDWVEPERPLLQALPCADVVWTRPTGQSDAKTRHLGTRGEADRYDLPVDEETQLYDDKGKLLARLKPTEPVNVEAYQKAGARQRIVLELSNGTLFGWVARSALRDMRGRMGRGLSGNTIQLYRGVEQPATGMRCRVDVPLIALVGDQRLAVGHIQSGTWFSLGAALDAHTEVTLRHPLHKENGKTVERVAFTVLEGARLAVQNEAIAACERN